MSISAGDSGCTSGLSGSIYTALTGDSSRNGFIGNSPPADWHDMVRAICWAVANQVATAHNSDAYLPKENFSTPSSSTQNAGSVYSSWTNVTPCQFSAVASGIYSFEFLFTAYSTQAGVFPWFQVVGPASPTVVQMTLQSWDATNGAVAVPWSAFSSAYQNGNPVLSARLMGVKGILQNGANAGTVGLQLATSNVNFPIVVLAGAHARYAKLN